MNKINKWNLRVKTMTAFWRSMPCMVPKTTAQIIIIRVFKVLRNNKFIVGYEQIYKIYSQNCINKNYSLFHIMIYVIIKQERCYYNNTALTKINYDKQCQTISLK